MSRIVAQSNVKPPKVEVESSIRGGAVVWLRKNRVEETVSDSESETGSSTVWVYDEVAFRVEDTPLVSVVEESFDRLWDEHTRPALLQIPLEQQVDDLYLAVGQLGAILLGE